MEFEYFMETIANGSIDIEDIGNVCLKACNDNYDSYYLLICTQYGTTEIIEYGPLSEVSDDLPNSLLYNYSRIQYDVRKIKSTIDKFINNYKYNITQVSIIEFDELKEIIKNPIDNLINS